jgi:hypothetical protein
MTGKHVIFACELGNGLRQADRILPIAAGLVAAGHRVSVAMPEGAPAASLIAAAGHPVLTGPSWRAEPPPGFLAANFADVLLQTGFATPEALAGLLDGWLALYRAEAPALVIADFAPTAMLACRVAEVRFGALGDGYGLPPATAPLPTMRPWAELPAGTLAATLAETDGRVIAVITRPCGASAPARSPAWRSCSGARQAGFAPSPSSITTKGERKPTTSAKSYRRAEASPSTGPRVRPNACW